MFSDPQKNVFSLELARGAHVADFGAGSGFYATAAAKVVGEEGKVFAVDVQKDLLDRLRAHAAHEGVSNVETVWGDVERGKGSRLRDDSVDAVIVANTLFQLDDKQGTLREAARVLKPGGQLLLVDWTESFGGMGPQPGTILSRDAGLELATLAGFIHDKDIQAGDHHWGMVCSYQ